MVYIFTYMVVNSSKQRKFIFLSKTPEPIYYSDVNVLTENWGMSVVTVEWETKMLTVNGSESSSNVSALIKMVFVLHICDIWLCHGLESHNFMTDCKC